MTRMSNAWDIAASNDEAQWIKSGNKWFGREVELVANVIPFEWGTFMFVSHLLHGEGEVRNSEWARVH